MANSCLIPSFSFHFRSLPHSGTFCRSGLSLITETIRDLGFEGAGEVETGQHERNEQRVRRIARRQGYELHRDRAGVWSFNHQGGWRIVDAKRNWLVAGERFDLSLEDVDEWLAEEDRARATAAGTA